MADLAILSPSIKPTIERAVSDGASHNPEDMTRVGRIVLAVKPARWREAAAGLAGRIPRQAVIVSVMAGVRADALSAGFGAHPVARVMPTTAVSAARGVATVWSHDDDARQAAVALFAPIAELLQVDREDLIDVATAVSGSGAAYVYAFVRSMARAGEAAGLTPEQARILALATASGALTRLQAGEGADALIAEVASPGGTTQAGLTVLEPDLTHLVHATVQAALAKSRELGLQ